MKFFQYFISNVFALYFAADTVEATNDAHVKLHMEGFLYGAAVEKPMVCETN